MYNGDGKRREMLKEDTLITSLYLKEVSIATQTKQLSPVLSGGILTTCDISNSI